MKTIILAIVVVAIMAPEVFAAGKEYTRLHRQDFQTKAEYREYRSFIRIKGLRGIPDECELERLRGELTVFCLPIKIRGTRQ